MTLHQIEIEVDGDIIAAEVEGRLTLGDFLRHQAGRTGVHMGCEHGVCGACTVSLNGEAVRSCLMLAVQADGARIGTIHGLAETDGTLHPVQAAMQAEYKIDPGYYGAGTYISAAVLEAALKSVGGKIEDHDAFMHALRTNVVQDTVRGPVKFDAHGDVGGTFAHWEIQDGKIETVKIFEPKM